MTSTSEIIIRLLLGTIIGGVIGFERQTHGRPAGFRTHILVCIASVLLMLISEHYFYLSSSITTPGFFRADPGRIAAGAITGIGFLGAGVILKTGFTIQGLTTAACIWVVAAIGLAIGSGVYLPSIITSIITIVTLVLLRNIEKRMPKLSFRFLTISADSDVKEDDIVSVLSRYGITTSNVDYERSNKDKETVFHITVAYTRKISLKALVDEIAALQFIKKVYIKNH